MKKEGVFPSFFVSRHIFTYFLKGVVQGIEVQCSALIKGGSLDSEIVFIILRLQKFKKPVKINLALADMQSFQVFPIHITAVIVVYMHVSDSRKKPIVLRVIKRFFQAVKFRHLRIEGAHSIGANGYKPAEIAYRVRTVANNVFDGKKQAVAFGNLTQALINAYVVIDILVRIDSTPK